MTDFNTYYRKNKWKSISNTNNGETITMINASKLEDRGNKIVVIEVENLLKKKDVKIELDARQTLMLINRLKALVRDRYPGAIAGSVITREYLFDDDGNPIDEEAKTQLEYSPYSKCD